MIKELEALLNKGGAHASFDEAVDGLPFEALGLVPGGLPYSIWQLTEHIRIAQWDMLEFSRNPDHKSPPWPEGYWPKEQAPPDATTWKKTLREITADRNAFIALLQKGKEQIFTPFAHDKGQSLFREALQIADHNAYHTAEIIVIRRLLGKWK